MKKISNMKVKDDFSDTNKQISSSRMTSERISTEENEDTQELMETDEEEKKVKNNSSKPEFKRLNSLHNRRSSTIPSHIMKM